MPKNKPPKPKLHKRKKYGAVIIAAVLLLAASGSAARKSSTKPKTTSDAVVQESAASEPEQAEYKIPFGEVLSVITNDIEGKHIAVVKAKIENITDNQTTVKINYYNIQHLVESGFDEFDEIQYWAVADTNGKDMKLISFTVPKYVISQLADGRYPANQMEDDLKDLWISPSLQ